MSNTRRKRSSIAGGPVVQTASWCAGLMGAALAFGGCGSESGQDTSQSPTTGSATGRYSESARFGGGEGAAEPAVKGEADGDEAGPLLQVAIQDEAGANEAAPGEAARPVRRVIYNATLQLTVADLDGTAETISRLVPEAGGYISDSTIRGTSGSQRSATWTVRVPIDRFDGFLREASRLGEVNSLSTRSQEVTAEFYDSEARLRNKRQEEQRLLTLLESGAGSLEEVLKVETEISRIRQEIEQIEGRLRLLRDLTALSTATIHATEVHEYMAAQPGDFPTFGERVGTAWTRTLDTLLAVGQRIVIFAVTLAPWIAAFFAVALSGLVLYRITRRSPRAANAPSGRDAA